MFPSNPGVAGPSRWGLGETDRVRSDDDDDDDGDDDDLAWMIFFVSCLFSCLVVVVNCACCCRCYVAYSETIIASIPFHSND